MNSEGSNVQFGLRTLLLWVMLVAACCVTGVEASQRGYKNDWTMSFFLLLSVHTGASIFVLAFSKRLEYAKWVADRSSPTTSQASEKSKLFSVVIVFGSIVIVFGSIFAGLMFVWMIRFATGLLISLATPVPFLVALNIAVTSSKRLRRGKAGRLVFSVYGKHSWVRQIYLACVAIGLVALLALGPGPKFATIGVVIALFIWDAMVPELQIYERAMMIRGRSCLPRWSMTEFRWNEFISGELVIVTSNGFRTSISVRSKDESALSRLMHSYLETPTHG